MRRALRPIPQTLSVLSALGSGLCPTVAHRGPVVWFADLVVPLCLQGLVCRSMGNSVKYFYECRGLEKRDRSIRLPEMFRNNHSSRLICSLKRYRVFPSSAVLNPY